MSSVFLAVEDGVSHAVGVRLIREANPDIYIQLLGKTGNGYLRSKILNFIEASKYTPVILLTDLDNFPCPLELIGDWIGIRNLPPQFLFRIAVKEVESWLLADHRGVNNYMGRHITNLPENPDILPDPKHFMLRTARRASREIRSDMVHERDALITQGLGYNARLTTFVNEYWCPIRASDRSESLKRTRRRLQTFL